MLLRKWYIGQSPKPNILTTILKEHTDLAMSLSDKCSLRPSTTYYILLLSSLLHK